MRLRANLDKRTGRTYLAIVHGYRDSDGKPKTKVVQSLGYLDILANDYDDPIAHFTAVAEEMENERKNTKSITITLNLAEQLDRANRKNYGHVIYSQIYHELEIDRFLNNVRRHKKFTFNSESIMRLLIYTRLLEPGSKRASYLNKNLFFDKFDFALHDIYDALTHFDEIADNLQVHLHGKIKEQYGRKTDLVYYDVTNYYFEIDKQDDFRKKGYSKEHRKDPIVQMGLMMDTNSFPIAYKLFPGNTHDSQTLMPMLKELKKKFAAKRIITVADKGLNCGDNIAFAAALGDGYTYSKSVRGANASFKSWVLEEKEYRHLGDSYKIKSKIVPDAEINVTVSQDRDGKKKKKKIKVEQKWIAFYSEKYAIRSKCKREEVIEKALQMIKNPAKYQRTVDYGAAGYIKNIKINKDTGEILNIEDTLLLDQQKIEEEEQYDGYYAIVTSELDDSDEHIIEMYKGLWRIEESFKVTKSVLNSRPIYLQRQDHINAHFLICFISLLIGRIVEFRLNRKYSINRIKETLQKTACSRIDQNVWLFDYTDEITDSLNSIFETNFGRAIMTLQEIKNIFAKSKDIPSGLQFLAKQ